MKPKNSFDKVALAVVIVCVVLCMIFIPFLSDEIAIQWHGSEVCNTANKLFILVLPLISLILYLSRYSLGLFLLVKRGIYSRNEALISYTILLVEILLLSGVVSIILFDVGIPLTVGSIIILEIIIGTIIGFKILPKKI